MDVDEATLAVLKKSPVFAGIDPAELPGLLRALGVYTRSFSKGEAVFRSGDKLKAVPVVLKGRIEARMLGKDGSRQIISRFEVGDSFAEAVPMAVGTAPVEAIALQGSVILFLPAEGVKGNGDGALLRLYANVMGEMSKKVKTLTAKLALLSEPRLRKRIALYLRRLPEDKDGYVIIPYSRKALAEYLAVNDKALLRELRRMIEEGVIEGEGRRLKLTSRGDL